MPKFCKECEYSKPDLDSTWELRCINPNVNAESAWALASAIISGCSCRWEREKGFFSACGKKGKQFKLKEV